MSDRREKILRRLMEILSATGEFGEVKRNTLALNDKITSAVVFDADETMSENDPLSWTPTGRAQMMTMRPEIYIVLSAKHADVGSTLNRLRAVVYYAIVNDQMLHDILGSNGRALLGSTSTALASGRQMTGELKLSFELTYPLIAKELVSLGSANQTLGDVVVS